MSGLFLPIKAYIRFMVPCMVEIYDMLRWKDVLFYFSTCTYPLKYGSKFNVWSLSIFIRQGKRCYLPTFVPLNCTRTRSRIFIYVLTLLRTKSEYVTQIYIFNAKENGMENFKN